MKTTKSTRVVWAGGVDVLELARLALFSLECGQIESATRELTALIGACEKAPTDEIYAVN